jgi:hypothetical protein
MSSNYSRAGVVVNFVTATGGDVEMLRSIECFYKYVLPISIGIIDTDINFVGLNAYVYRLSWMTSPLISFRQPEVPISLRDVL